MARFDPLDLLLARFGRLGKLPLRETFHFAKLFDPVFEHAHSRHVLVYTYTNTCNTFMCQEACRLPKNRIYFSGIRYSIWGQAMGKASQSTKVFAYLRTSSAANIGEDKDSGRRQLHAIEAYAKRGGVELVGTYHDEAVKLGNPKLSVARKSALEAVTVEADRFAANVLPIIREAQKAGAATLREIASALNARGVATARGGHWYAKSVANILERA
jgi:hypothetical protein